MKKNHSGKRGASDSAPQHVPPDKVGWIRKFCGKGIFREIWRNRFMVLRGDQLLVCEKEVRGAELGRADEVLDLTDFDRVEEIRKNKSRSKKNLSKFRLQRCSSPGGTVSNLVFLAVSPEEKESWISVLNVSITRAKNKILDEVTVEDSQLSHLTRDRVKIPQSRRLPTRAHLLAVASSSSDGMLTVDLIQEEAPPPRGADGRDRFRVDSDKTRSHQGPDCPRSKTDGALSAGTAEASGKSQSLPREAATVREPMGRTRSGGRRASMDETLKHPDASPGGATASVSRLQEMIHHKLEETERLLVEVRGEARERGRVKGKEATEAKRLLKEAAATWNQAQEVLEEVKELRALCRQLDAPPPLSRSNNSTKLNQDRKSLM